MDKQILNFTVNEQILVCENPIKISTNKVNYIQASFDLGTNWDGFDSVRAVWFNDFNCISTVLDSLGNCVVPFEVMKRKGNVKVNLVGSISEDDVLTDRLTSYPVVAVIVDCTAQITGANTQPITPSEFEQFAQRVHTDADRAETAASSAETSAQNASDSATSAHNSAESAHDDKIAIEQAIAEVIQQIEDFEQVQVVVNTLPPSSQATSDFTDGVLTLGIPQGVKGDTGNGIQSIAKVGTSGLVDTYRITYTDGQTTTFTVTNGAKGDTGNGIASIEKTSTVGLVDTYTITYTNGNTTTFTVTNGEKGDKGDTGEVSLSELEQATVVQTLSDSVPYNYRRTNNGQGAGVREYDEIVGASVGWNQLAEAISNGLPVSSNVTATKDIPNNSIKISGSVPSVKYAYCHFYVFKTSVINHIYIIGFKIKVNTLTPTKIWTKADNNGVTINTFYHGDGIYWTISKATTNGQLIVGATYEDEDIGSAFDIDYTDIVETDLTLFNTKIADYVYNLEQSTAGSGVAWLKSHFPKLFDNGYQPFDSGSIKSVSGLTAHEMVGVNQWDEEWEVGGISTSNGANINQQRLRSKNYIPLIVGETYNFLNTPRGNLSVYWYDENKVFKGSESLGTALNVAFFPQYPYMRFVEPNITAYSNDICINLSDTSINGQYFPHEKHTYPLDSSVTLRGQYKLNNGVLYAVGDVWKSSGEFGRTWGKVDLGTLNWNKDTVGDNWGFYIGNGIIPNLKLPATNSNMINAVMGKRLVTTANLNGNYTTDKTFFAKTNGQFFIVDKSYSTASDFKTAMSGQYLVYELATPTTENATAYESPQWCDSHGTEEYVGSELPVGHNTDYPMTLIDTADGLSNGTFEPRITVTNGVRTVTWVSV